MRIKFLKGLADAHGGYFEPGQIIEMPEASAAVYLSKVYDDGTRLAVEATPTVCPHCGGELQDMQGPPGAPESELEAATVSHRPRRRG